MIYDLEYDRVVLGGDLQSLKYAHKNTCPVIFFNPNPPNIIEGGREEWDALCMSLSLAGLIPFGEKVSRLRIENNKLIVIASNKTYVVAVGQKLIVSNNGDNIEGLPTPYEKCDKFKVVDWINVYSGMSHDIHVIEDTTDFVKCVFFYPTERLDGYHPDKKDAAAISYMTGAQLKDPDWSDSYVRLKVLKMMQDHGIRGKIEVVKREVQPDEKTIYPKTEFVEFI